MSFLTESDVAAHFDVNKSTVRRWRGAGKLPYFRVGSVVRYRVEDVETFDANHSVDSFAVGLKAAPARRQA